MHDTLIQWASYWEGGLAWVVITGLFLLGGLILVPRAPLCMLAGVTFGAIAFPYALIASTAGALLGFVLARYFFHDWFQRKLLRWPNAKLVADAIDADGWTLLVLMRLASPVPGPVSNYAFGLSSMTMMQYLTATIIGIAPQVIAFVYLGVVAKVAIDDKALSSVKLMFGIAGAVVTLLVVALVTRRLRGMMRSRLAVAKGNAAPSNEAQLPG